MSRFDEFCPGTERAIVNDCAIVSASSVTISVSTPPLIVTAFHAVSHTDLPFDSGEFAVRKLVFPVHQGNDNECSKEANRDVPGGWWTSRHYPSLRSWLAAMGIETSWRLYEWSNSRSPAQDSLVCM
jgi:hypothetical protein